MDSGYDAEVSCSLTSGPCHPFALNKYQMTSCVPNQCAPPCSRTELLQRNPPLRTACHLPTFCRGGPRTVSVPGLVTKSVAFCGMDDAGSGAGKIERGGTGKLATAPRGVTYERAFWLHGFGGNMGRCEWYHAFVEVTRIFQMIMEEFDVDLDRPVETFPSKQRVVIVAEEGVAKVLPACQAFRQLLTAQGHLDMGSGGCFRNGVVGLSNTAWVSGFYPLPWKPVTATMVKYMRAFRSVMLARTLNLNATQVRRIDGPAAAAALCNGKRRPRLLIMDRATSGRNRGLVNRERLEAAAMAAGFDVVAKDPQGEVADQIRFLAQFDAIFGRHGAGLAWSTMLPSYGVVVEMVAKGSGTKKEYYNKWDARDPHYYLFANWAVSGGLAYMTWEAEATAPQSVINEAKDEDWKHGPFQVTVGQAKEYAASAMRALRANARCDKWDGGDGGADSSMPPGVAHWQQSTRSDSLNPAVALPVANPPYARSSGLKSPAKPHGR